MSMRGVRMLKLAFVKVGRRLLVLFAFGLIIVPLKMISAHEFWIEPSSFQSKAGQIITADLLIGTDFLGSPGIYVPDEIEAFAVFGPNPDTDTGANTGTNNGTGSKTLITGRYGDRPAGRFMPTAPGLNIILHQTAPIYLTYQDPEKFAAFAREKGFAGALLTHRKRGLSPAGITERYQRFAKSLIMVSGDQEAGNTAAMNRGSDRVLNLAIELVAEDNPYQNPPPAMMPMRLYANGKPLAAAQITVFTRHNPRHVETMKYVTDVNGRVNFAVIKGRDYLVDCVILRPVDQPDANWESLWASLSFTIP